MKKEVFKYSAAPSLAGYLYQCDYALLECFNRLSNGEEFAVSIETLDDVVFEHDDWADLFQTKHHRVDRAADLGDSSHDIWRTLRIWCDIYKQDGNPSSINYYLITTSKAPIDSAAFYLKPGPNRDLAKAVTKLNSVAESSPNKENENAYQIYRSLDNEKRKDLLSFVYVLDSAPLIDDIENELAKKLYYIKDQFKQAFVFRFTGLWHYRLIKHLRDRKPILSEEIGEEISDLSDQFKDDNLPIDPDIMNAEINPSEYEDRIFVNQLRLIEVIPERVLIAIKNYYRALAQRSRWLREELLLVGELDKYENKLVEEWNIMFLRMKQELGEKAAEKAKIKAARELYNWAEIFRMPIRPRVGEASMTRGSLHLLADRRLIGWHPEFLKRLSDLLKIESA